MKDLTFEEENNRVYTKKEVQILILELNAFLVMLHIFCKKYRHCEGMDSVLACLNYMGKITYRLFLALDVLDSFDEFLDSISSV